MMQTDLETLIKCDPNVTIWRYINLHKLELLLEQESLFFCRADKFADPFEATIPKREAENRIEEELRVAISFNRPMTREQAKIKSEEIGALHRKFRRSFIVNCWYISNNESEAMWNLYLKTNEGVAIQSTYGRLVESLSLNEDEIFISKVRYLDYEKDIWYHKYDYPNTSYNLMTPIIHKRIEFSHENELRIFQQINEAVHDDTFWDKEPINMGRNLICESKVLIEKLVLPPTADKDVEDKLKAIIEKYSLEVEMVKSKLSEDPIY